MKGIAQIALIGLVGTFTIVAGIIIPPSIIKLTIAKESVFTYAYEKGQHALLALFYSSQGDKSGYELLSQKALFESFECDPTKNKADGTNPACPDEYKCDKTFKACTNPTTKPLKDRLDNVIGKDKYCITTDKPVARIPTGQYFARGVGGPEPAVIESSDEILRKVCPSSAIIFNTVIVLPYNKESLVKLIGIGVG